MSRLFTLDEASLREAISAKGEYEALDTELRETSQRIAMSGGATVNRGRLIAVRARRDDSAERLKAAFERIDERGCLVKDLDTGLIDFPTRFRGEEVCLCWKLGERSIQFWHGANEGFRGRKPIDREFRESHRGDAAN